MTQDLRSYLSECAEILRGSAVDRTDWKAYILSLLFFKRISDVCDEETADATALFGDAEPVDFPEVHRFSIPAGCHWRDVRETRQTLAPRSPTPCARSTARSPDTLYRVFGAADWGSREMLTDEILKDLMEVSGMSSPCIGCDRDWLHSIPETDANTERPRASDQSPTP